MNWTVDPSELCIACVLSRTRAMLARRAPGRHSESVSGPSVKVGGS